MNYNMTQITQAETYEPRGTTNPTKKLRRIEHRKYKSYLAEARPSLGLKPTHHQTLISNECYLLCQIFLLYHYCVEDVY